MSLRPAWLTLRRYAAATTGMTLALFALGVYTAATGSGLACEAQWPLCSDQLIPALTINPDFIEWFHRVWAMVTGFLIIGLAAWAWLGDADRRVRLAATAAVAILPLQITVGAITVTIGGLVPGGYTVSTHAAHLIVALIIFTLLGLATAWAGNRGGTPRLVRLALGVGFGGVLASALFSRAVPILTYSPSAQGIFYLVALLGHLGLVTAVVFAVDAGYRPETTRLVRGLAGASMALLVGTMLLGRDLVLYTGTWETINQVVLVAAVVTAAAALWIAAQAGDASVRARPANGD